uniref:Uncharacterized protein n=1 Tax=Xenopus tropicalis TaxID=8364 RepID=A0A6I8QM72_XENTR
MAQSHLTPLAHLILIQKRFKSVGQSNLTLLAPLPIIQKKIFRARPELDKYNAGHFLPRKCWTRVDRDVYSAGYPCL